MPFRAKMRRAFSGKKNNDDSHTSTSESPPKRTDIEYYKPGEIPRSKYRGPWNQKHQNKLQSFSFDSAFRDRKNSVPSAYSPRGTHAQSRRSSWVSRARSSMGGKSDGEDAGAVRRKSHASHVGQVVEDAEDEADVANVGLSRQATTEPRNLEETNKLQLEKTFTQGHVKEEENSQLFTPEELSKAMTTATIKSATMA